MPTPHILLLSENLLINEIPSSLVHSKPPSKPNQCVCVCVGERCRRGVGYTPTDKSPHREAAQQKRRASQLGRGLPVAKATAVIPEYSCGTHSKLSGLWRKPHILCFCPPLLPYSTAPLLLLLTSTPLGKVWPLLHSAWAVESPTSPQRPVLNYESSAGRDFMACNIITGGLKPCIFQTFQEGRKRTLTAVLWCFFGKRSQKNNEERCEQCELSDAHTATDT